MIISNDVLQFVILPFITSYDSNTRLIDVYKDINKFNSYACDVFCSGRPMPDFQYDKYGKLDSYKQEKLLFSLKDLGLIN